MKRLIAVLAILLAVGAGAQNTEPAQAQTSGTGYCMEDYTQDNYVDIFDLGQIATHAFETVPFGSPFDVAPPPDGTVSVIGDISRVASMFGEECEGFYEQTETQASVGEGAQSQQITVYCLFRARHNHRHPFMGVPPNQTALMDHEAFAYCQSPDPLATTVQCWSQLEQDPPPLDDNWVLRGSYTGVSTGWYCHAWSPYLQPAIMPTYINSRARVCAYLYYWGEFIDGICNGEEFSWMLVVH